ncbi:hypothetical protein CC86DRAFT_438851 [Ophiobolus disseminans]|uniref:Uncharacterized protein n=1 Tax=Ophiobolus disseminans TaxID=1469910 RepID=A0A6A7A5B2_9PLEO|nr:hypothetical protein CC86DRAFT_438851 [Ophiobolus disseminans]
MSQLEITTTSPIMDMDVLHHEADGLWFRLKLSQPFSEMVETLWRRVSNELAPLYANNNKIISPDLEVAICLLIIDVITIYIGDDTVAECYDHFEKSLLEHKKVPQTRRLFQLVETMLLLTPILPIDREWIPILKIFTAALLEHTYDEIVDMLGPQ